MKRTKLSLLLLIASFVGLQHYHAEAQVFAADIKTIVGGGDTGIADRLYQDSGFSTLAENGDLLWFVSDPNNDGIGGGNTPSTVLGGDDVLVFQDTIAGTLPFDPDGRYQGTTNNDIPLEHDDNQIFAILWQGQSPNAVENILGSGSYGFAEVVVTSAGGIGNSTWHIDTNINGSQLALVPEPSSYAVVAALGLSGLAAYRRRRGRN